MFLSSDNIKNMNSNEIFVFLNTNCDGFYKKYKFFLGEDHFNELLMQVINKVKASDSKSIEEQFVTDYNEYIHIAFADIDSAFSFLNNFINQNYKIVTNAKKAIQIFCTIGQFFDENDIELNIDLVQRLVASNAVFGSMIKIIVNNYNKVVISGKYEDIFEENQLLVSAIECYCNINNIAIDYDYDFTKEKGLLKSDDPVAVYLKEIGRIPLLTPEQEVALAKKAKDGDKEAENLFIESNLRLVVSVAKRYVSTGMELLDLIQEGNLGLLKAFERFNPDLGYKFSTYSRDWIRQYINRALGEKSRTIRIPVHVKEKLYLLSRASEEFSLVNGRDPTNVELSEMLGMPVEKIDFLSSIQLGTVSLSTKINDDEDSELEDFIPSSEMTPEERFLKDDFARLMREVIEKADLDPREKYVLYKRYGLNYSKMMKLEEIAKEFHVTREWIRQIEKRALKKLRNSKYSALLANYLDNPKLASNNVKKYNASLKVEEDKKNGVGRTVYHYFPASMREEIDYVVSDGYLGVHPLDSKNLATIYSLLKDYSSEAIDAIIDELSVDDLKLLHRRYGPDFKRPIFTLNNLTDSEKRDFYNVLIPKMRKMLARPMYSHLYKKSNTLKGTIYVEVKPFYEMFDRYVKSDVDEAVSALKLAQKKFLYSIYSEDLNDIKQPRISKSQYDGPYTDIIKEIRRILEDNKAVIQPNRSFYQYFVGHTKKEIDGVIDALTVEEKEIIDKFKKEIVLSNQEIMHFRNVIVPKIYSEIRKKRDFIKYTDSVIKTLRGDKCKKIKDCQFLKTEAFKTLVSSLSFDEALIVGLKLSYMDGKSFSNIYIAKSFGKTEDEIKNIFEGALQAYYEDIGESFDSEIYKYTRIRKDDDQD